MVVACSPTEPVPLIHDVIEEVANSIQDRPQTNSASVAISLLPKLQSHYCQPFQTSGLSPQQQRSPLVANEMGNIFPMHRHLVLKRALTWRGKWWIIGQAS